MNMLREQLARRADEAGQPDLAVDYLLVAGERRLRRRRAGAVLASAVAVVVTVVLALAATSFVGTERSNGPVDKPRHEEPAREAVRKIVYADLGADPGPPGTLARADGRYIHYGAGKVETGRTYVNMDVTDDAGRCGGVRGVATASPGSRGKAVCGLATGPASTELGPCAIGPRSWTRKQ